MNRKEDRDTAAAAMLPSSCVHSFRHARTFTMPVSQRCSGNITLIAQGLAAGLHAAKHHQRGHEKDINSGRKRTHTHTLQRCDATSGGGAHTCNSPSPPRPIFLTTRLACDRRMAGSPQPHPGPLVMMPKRSINGSHPLCPAASPHTCAHGTPKVTPRVPTDVKHSCRIF